MLLTIDVGNTNSVLCVFDREAVVEHWRIATDPVRTADELAVTLRGLLSQSPLLARTKLDGIALCSTVPSVLHEMREMLARYYEDVPALIVVDFGTSTNFDAVSARGEFVGGALAPGIEISVDALSRRAAQLLKVELARPNRVIGRNTVEALQSGIIFGFAGQIEGIARRMAKELAPADPDSVTIIATGGLAPLIIDEVGLIDAYEPWLTLIGLRLTFERNTADGP